MDNQHQQIKGYRDLTQAEIDLMNEGEALAQQVGDYIDKLRSYPAAMDRDGHPRVGRAGEPSLDQRWVSVGATQLQQGFMAVIRGIAQPTTF